MDLNSLTELLGEKTTITLTCLVIGLLFGVCAQRSRFCMRSAAIVATQLFISRGWLDVSQPRQLSTQGSLSDALIGGLLFGIGMILARGCSSRMLVLAANGNLRALLTGLVFAVTARASLNGLLSPVRAWLAGLWTIEGGATRDLLATFHLGHRGGFLFGLVWLASAIHFAQRARLGRRESLGGIGVGVMIAFAWLLTFQIGTHSFDIIPVQSLSFTGPSANVLMLALSPPGQPWNSTSDWSPASSSAPSSPPCGAGN